jgi:hypothetical protein
MEERNHKKISKTRTRNNNEPTKKPKVKHGGPHLECKDPI